MIFIYSDGSSNGRADGPFGWGTVVLRDDKILSAFNGGGPVGTNNIAELEGAIQGFCYLLNENILEPVTLASDSEYTLGNAAGIYTPKKNIEQCKLLRRLFKFFETTTSAETMWVKGHSGDIYNEMADKLAKSARAQYPAKKRKGGK